MDREKAIEIATKAHAGQKRKNSGEDYITHPLAVAKIAEKIFWDKFADRVDEGVDIIAKKIYIVAVLHDVIEDTSVTFEEISKEFPDTSILQALSMLTRQEEQNYYDFIQNIYAHGDLISLIVKVSDIEHNMSDLKEGSLKDKYRFALEHLREALFFPRIFPILS
jgi:(p)ppGpp synthase/HD superfamily hydrolase